MLPTPTFHHVHLNSPNPDAAIDFYVRQFASTSKTTWGDMAALQSPNQVMLLFNKVASEPPVLPNTRDSRSSMSRAANTGRPAVSSNTGTGNVTCPALSPRGA